MGMWATSSQAAITSGGRPSRSAPTISVTSPSMALNGSPSRATRAILRPGSSETFFTRATGTENSAPIEARTALWP